MCGFPSSAFEIMFRELLLNCLPERKQNAAEEVPVCEYTSFREDVLNIQCSHNEDSTVVDNESKSQRAEGHRGYYT